MKRGGAGGTAVPAVDDAAESERAVDGARANANPAEFMLEVCSFLLVLTIRYDEEHLGIDFFQAIGAGVTPRIGDRDWKDIWLESPEFQKTVDEIATIKAEALSRPAPEKKMTSTCGVFVHLGPLHNSYVCRRVVILVPTPNCNS